MPSGVDYECFLQMVMPDDVDEAVADPVHHNESALGSSALKRGPLEFFLHVGNAAGTVVNSSDEPSSSPLHHLNLVDVSACVWVP